MSILNGTMDEENDAERRRERYKSVLRTVEYQTGGPNSPSPQAAGVRQSSVVVTTCVHGEWSPEKVRRSIRAAVENDDLFAWLDGTERRLARTTPEGIRAVVAEQNQLTDPDTSVIERAVASKGD